MVLSTIVAALSLASQSAVVIQNVSIIDPGRTQIRTGQDVLLRHGTIEDVGPTGRIRIPGSAKAVDGSGKFLIPGLWDMHVHWYDQKALSLFTANGVTGIRIMFGMPLHKTWRAKTASGELLGPRMVVASPIVDGAVPVWPGSIALKGPGEAKALVERLKAEQWDFIKGYSEMSREAFVALAKEAWRQRMPIGGHIPLSVNIMEAAHLGYRCNEHLTGIRDAASKYEHIALPKFQEALRSEDPKKALSKAFDDIFANIKEDPYDPTKAERLFRALAKTRMWQCPTLVVLRSMAHLDVPEFIKDDRLKYMPPATRSRWNPANDFRLKDRKVEDWVAERRAYKKDLAMIKPLYDAGNRFLAGTDCLNPYCFPGFSLHDELALIVEAGLTPVQALETATLNPARFLGQERRWGTIGKGKLADVVLLARNPHMDIRNTTSIIAVIQGGRLWERAELDAMLKANEH